MKSINETQYVEKIGNVQETGFRINASAASFQILSSGLYSNKILAIVRELSCNAYDAHKAAGRADIPFEVTLPRELQPNFIIRDFGTGLSHEQVMTTYTTYFESTKNDSDDYIGQLGLGSKSPFSYTNQFMVQSRQNGVSNFYTMFINESGIPAVSHMGSSGTDEENGLTITIAVKSADFYKFALEAEKALMYFDPYPTVYGSHTRKEFQYRIRKDTWAIREDKHGSRTPRIIQGFVQYPIDTSQLNEYVSDDLKLSDVAVTMLSAPIDMYVPIGLVQVAPSREHLSYDKKTIQNIIKFINGVSEDVIQSLSDMIEGCPTLWDARMMALSFTEYNGCFRKIHDSIRDRRFLNTYKGINIQYGVNLSNVDLSDMIINTHSVSRNRVSTNMASCNNSGLLRETIRIYLSTKILYNDCNVSATKIRKYIVSNERDNHIIELRAYNKKVAFADKVDTFLKLCGIEDKSDIILASDLVASGVIDMTKIPRVVNSTPKKKKEENYVYNGSISRECFRYSWDIEEIDFSKGGYYVNICRFKWVDAHGNRQSYLHSNITWMKDNNIIPKDAKIIGVNAKDATKFIDSPLWHSLDDVCAEWVSTNIEAFSISEATRKYEHPSRGVYALLCEIAESLEVDSYLKKYIGIVGENFKIANMITALPDRISYKRKVDQDIVERAVKAAAYDNLIEMYPMITLALPNNMEGHMETITQYMSDVDAARRNEVKKTEVDFCLHVA